MAESIEERHKEIFRALVELQDKGLGTERSRVQIANQFSVSITEIQHVEREGITKKWPPLADDGDRGAGETPAPQSQEFPAE